MVGTGAATVGVLGRFQPFHWGHFEYVVEAARLGHALKIGITNPDHKRVRRSDNDVRRSEERSNPFSFDQRASMIDATLTALTPGISFSIVPCDLRSPFRLRETMGDCDLFALTVYDDWGEERLALAEEAAYVVQVLWRRQEKLVTGTQVRERMERGLAWDHLVPRPCAAVVRSLRHPVDEVTR